MPNSDSWGRNSTVWQYHAIHKSCNYKVREENGKLHVPLFDNRYVCRNIRVPNPWLSTLHIAYFIKYFANYTSYLAAIVCVPKTQEQISQLPTLWARQAFGQSYKKEHEHIRNILLLRKNAKFSIQIKSRKEGCNRVHMVLHMEAYFWLASISKYIRRLFIIRSLPGSWTVSGLCLWRHMFKTSGPAWCYVDERRRATVSIQSKLGQTTSGLTELNIIELTFFSTYFTAHFYSTYGAYLKVYSFSFLFWFFADAWRRQLCELAIFCVRFKSPILLWPKPSTAVAMDSKSDVFFINRETFFRVRSPQGTSLHPPLDLAVDPSFTDAGKPPSPGTARGRHG